MRGAAIGLLLAGCGAPPAEGALPVPPRAPEPRSPEPASPVTSAAREPSCAADADCGYDPERARCVADPRANRQPPLVDQGIVCYCEGARCETLRVPPVPCESDASCAVRADPRPHPIAADAAHPHERGRPSRRGPRAAPSPGAPPIPCGDLVFSTTCERTNICTLHRPACPRR